MNAKDDEQESLSKEIEQQTKDIVNVINDSINAGKDSDALLLIKHYFDKSMSLISKRTQDNTALSKNQTKILIQALMQPLQEMILIYAERKHRKPQNLKDG
jgi:hypothetical protein